MIIKAVITTLDNLPLLKEQVRILEADPLISEIVVVNNGSRDGTEGWLSGQKGLTVVNRENKGAGPGRNAGLDAAGEFDFALMLDGGIRPLIGGTERMLRYLESTPQADVIGVEIADFETNYDMAWRRWANDIKPDLTYQNKRLSHTAYCLSRRRAWDGLRFSEIGPFAEPGWGVDDDEMAYRWNEAGIVVHVVVGIHPYRRASGSFVRLFKETGVWPNQYGSVYEKRLVWCQQNWPQYQAGIQWGEPWLTIVIRPPSIEEAATLIKAAHQAMRKRTFEHPYGDVPNPYSIILWTADPAILAWAEPRQLRQHHGDTIIVDGQIVKKNAKNMKLWTGDFRVWTGPRFEPAIRPGAHYYGLVTSADSLSSLIDAYNAAYPRSKTNTPPEANRLRL